MSALFGPTAAIVAILSLGLRLDRVDAGCDNSCREKSIHQFCDGGGWPCIKFVYKTALSKYENCDDECICEQDITVVEAKNLAGDSVYTPSIRRDNCAPPSW